MSFGWLINPIESFNLFWREKKAAIGQRFNVQISLNNLQRISFSSNFENFYLVALIKFRWILKTKQYRWTKGMSIIKEKRKSVLQNFYPVLAKFDHIKHMFLITVTSGSTNSLFWKAGLWNIYGNSSPCAAPAEKYQIFKL